MTDNRAMMAMVFGNEVVRLFEIERDYGHFHGGKILIIVAYHGPMLCPTFYRLSLAWLNAFIGSPAARGQSINSAPSVPCVHWLDLDRILAMPKHRAAD